MLNTEHMNSAEEKRLREVAKRTGAIVYTHPSKAYLDELNEQQKRADLSKRPSGQSMKKKHTESWVDGRKEKELVDFEDWKAVPLEMENYIPVPVDPNAPLKPALKKTSSLKPTLKPSLKSALKKESSQESKAYYSENESSRRSKHESKDRMKPPRVVVPSKAFLEEQQEKLELIKQRGWASHHPHQAARPVHEIHEAIPFRSECIWTQ
ncbi:hypothetical protein BJ912DRAFT_595395 [Pholiota molesta]|nr:hypothetical protein BJ912DRAFT_595395 [Pholiota molesta]